jgi:N-acylneuraminate cytidylyltransferase
MNIAIIPARKGSKRIKNKNIKNFNGRPMIYWTIKAAQKSKIFKKIYVDTDSKQIAKMSIKFGAEVPFLRSKKLANDKVSVNISTHRFILNLKKKKKLDFEILEKANIFQLMPNCPLRDSNDIIKLFKIFKKNKSNYLISHHKFLFGNPWWSIRINSKKIIRVFKKTYRKRSQDLPILYAPSGAVWIAKYDSFIKSKTFYGKNYSIGELEWTKAIDIDNLEEFNISQKL